MSPASRRIFLYWLLLLVPTLVVGAVAIQLLRRERAHIAVQGAYTQEARRAAVTARARLIVENVELLVGDVQAGLIDTLATEPERDLADFLRQWEKNNPLVRTAFICGPDGRLIRPAPDSSDENVRGFVRRFSSLLSENPPWSSRELFQEEDESRAAKKAENEAQSERKDIASNVAQVQSARRDVQELAKSRAYPALSNRASSKVARAGSAAPSAAGAFSVPASSADARQELAMAAPTEMKEKDPAADRRGWLSHQIDGRLHMIGWVQPAGERNVRGVELELAALVSRLGGALPVEIGAEEGYALRDDLGRVVHQVGAVLSRAETIQVPLAASLLPGWEVVAYLSIGPERSLNGGAFFWLSALLVGIFVTAILAGGLLLLRQARRSEEEAVQKTSFVANVSHEFKTPLTTIRLYSELLEQGRVRDAEQGGHYLRTIGRETERLTRLVNNALDFSRLEQGQKKYANERLDVVAELGRLMETHRPRVADAGLTLTSDLPSTPIFVRTDRDALEQIVLNLVDNACKYAAGGGEAVLSVSAAANGRTEVRLADRGPGVPPDQAERIFEKFHRVNDALTAEKTGAGLGLSIARQLARGLGGNLRYEARSGGGAEFILILP